MIYEYKPVQTNNKARLAVFLLLLAAVLAFVGSALVPSYPFILQTVGLCLLLPVIQLTARYLVLRYLYRLREREDGTVDFEIFAYRGGARMQLVCRVALTEITAAAPLDASNKRPPRELRRYGYHPDLAPDTGLLLSVSNYDGSCEILLSPDAHIKEVLTGAAEKNAARAAEDTTQE